MREVTIKVFQFAELSEEAKQKAIEKLYDINVDHDWWDMFDSLLEPTTDMLKSRRMEALDHNIFSYGKIYFDLDRGQYLQLIDIDIKDRSAFCKLLRIPTYMDSKFSYSFDNSVTNSNTTLEIVKDDYSDMTNKERDVAKRAIEIFSQLVRNGLKTLSDQYEYLTSKEAIIDTIEANEMEFTADGKLRNF